jgi:hypothetical protein
VRLHILCEDDLQKRLVERLADCWGVDRRRRFVDAAPKAINGSQYVLDHYVDVVRRWRRTSHDQHVYLVVMIDGDERGVAGRRQQLEGLLRVAGVDPADPARSAVLVPTWHIETWVAWLCGHRPIDETTRYKVQDAGGDVARKIKSEEYSPRRAVESWLPAHMEESAVVPSPSDARRELTRLGFEV